MAKRGKGSKIMARADKSGLPLSVFVATASPHEVNLVQQTLEACFLQAIPQRVIGDKACYSDTQDALLLRQGIETIAPHRSGKARAHTQDGRKLRRDQKRLGSSAAIRMVAELPADCRALRVPPDNFLGFVQLGCIPILLYLYYAEMASSPFFRALGPLLT